MNSLSLINYVKYNKTIYSIYNNIGSKCISLLKHFLKTNDKLIIFSSFGGRKFDDSPKAIYDAMIKDQRFEGCYLVWAFIHPEDYNLPRGKKVKIDTFQYYKTLLCARIWVTNSSMTRGLNFTGKNTFELNTWHGTPIKRMGSDVIDSNKSFGLKDIKTNKGVMLAQSQYDVDVFSKAFHKPTESFCITGLPRNDILAHVTQDIRFLAREKLGITDDKKVILYAPTFREYEKDIRNNCVLTPPMDLKKWKEELGTNHVLLLRAHYEVAKVMGIEDNEFVKNVSVYPNLNELMIASDILISDYSSIFFDYSIQGKPMICFAYDYDRYTKERGMYFDIREYLPHTDNDDELIRLIKSTDISIKSETTISFQKKFVTIIGSASKKALDIIYDNIC